MRSNSPLSALKYLVWVSTLGVSLAAPILLGVLGAHWLQTRFSLGSWCMVLGIVLGLATAGVNLAKFLRFMQREANKRDKEDKP